MGGLSTYYNIYKDFIIRYTYYKLGLLLRLVDTFNDNQFKIMCDYILFIIIF